MAQFIYKGEIPRPGLVAQYGPTTKLAVPKADGTKIVLENPSGFPPGQVVPFDFTDKWSIWFLSNDPRFQQV